MQIGGDIPIGGVVLFHVMSKGEKEKYQKSKIQVYEVRKGLSREGILSGGLTLFYQKRKGTWRETCEEKEKKHEDKGRIPKGRHHFPLMSKGGRNIKKNIDEE
jgi:hypothetical protein